MTKQSIQNLHRFLSLIAGALLPLAFAPFHLYLFAIISPAILLFCWQQVSSPRDAFLLGLLFGIGQFSVGVSWVYISIHEYGETPWWFAGSLTIVLILFLSLYPAFQGYLLNRFFPKNDLSKSVIAYPASWVVSEWLRSTLLSGFPWLLLSYSQITSIFGSWIPVLGCYGVTFIVTAISGLLVTCVLSKNKRQIIFSVLALVLLSTISFLLKDHLWTTPTNKTITASLIQGNITQSLKWSEDNFENSLSTYQQLTEKNWTSDLIVWPEAAIAVPYQMMKDFMQTLDELAKAHHTTLITGIPFEAEQKGFYYNGVTALGTGKGHYYKQHLLLYAETLPLQGLFQGLLDHFHLPAPNILPGAANQPSLISQDYLIAPFVCFDIVDSNVVRAALPQAQLLLTVSDDAWFGHSFAQAQQLEISQIRSLQTGRYQLAATNNGMTAIINEKGYITTTLSPFQQGVLTGKVQMREGATPWVSWGDDPSLGFSIAALFMAWMFQRRSFLFSKLSPSPQAEVNSDLI